VGQRRCEPGNAGPLAKPVTARSVASASELTRAMLGAPTRFSWRTCGSELLLWKRGGWSDGEELLACIGCVVNLLGRLADLDLAAV